MGLRPKHAPRSSRCKSARTRSSSRPATSRISRRGKSGLAQIRTTFGGAPSLAALIAGGWQGGRALFETTDSSAFSAMIASNTQTVHHALAMLLPAMVEKKHGSIVAIGSRAVERPWTSPKAAAYAASKAAAVALCQVAAEEVLEHCVRINAVLPSTMDTKANRSAMPNADPAKWVSVESAAKVIAFLLSDDAKDISAPRSRFTEERKRKPISVASVAAVATVVERDGGELCGRRLLVRVVSGCFVSSRFRSPCRCSGCLRCLRCLRWVCSG